MQRPSISRLKHNAETSPLSGRSVERQSCSQEPQVTLLKFLSIHQSWLLCTVCLLFCQGQQSISITRKDIKASQDSFISAGYVGKLVLEQLFRTCPDLREVGLPLTTIQSALDLSINLSLSSVLQPTICTHNPNSAHLVDRQAGKPHMNNRAGVPGDQALHRPQGQRDLPPRAAAMPAQGSRVRPAARPHGQRVGPLHRDPRRPLHALPGAFTGGMPQPENVSPPAPLRFPLSLRSCLVGARCMQSRYMLAISVEPGSSCCTDRRAEYKARYFSLNFP